MKKTGIILAVILFITVLGYLFIRYSVLRSTDFAPDNAQSRSALDLRPALIAKLKQIVKDASDGLYLLSIDSIEIDLSAGSVELINVSVSADSIRLVQLDSLRKAPDDVYDISFHKLHIGGIGLADLINRKHIDLDSIGISAPAMILYRTKRNYNTSKREEMDSLTLYQRITKHITHLAVRSVSIGQGSFRTVIHRNSSRNTSFGNLSVKMQDILVDSATQYDRNRFFFSANTQITSGALERRTADSLYFFRADSIFLEARSHTLTAFKVSLVPRGSRADFQKTLTHRGDRFDILVPKLVFREMNWWRLFNLGSIDCDRVEVLGGHLYDYVSGALPPRPIERIDNFPYQTLRRLSIPLNIKRVDVRNFNISYTEYYPPSGRNGTLYFDRVNGSIRNVINMPRYISKGMWCTVTTSSHFMHSIPVRISFGFDMNRYKTGTFSIDIRAGKIAGTVLDPVTEPLSFFVVKSGVVDSVSTHLSGNNTRATAVMKLLYHDLHITTLKKQKQEPGDLKKKRLLNFIANTFVIKDENPHKKDPPRIASAQVNREPSRSFFNFAWRAIRLALFQSVGIPDTFAPK
jgi:hypothetical protein